MNPVLIFASLGAGLLLTLLYGPQWGIMMGLMTFLAGLGLLQSQEITRLKAELEKRLNELPELVHRLVEEKIKALAPSLSPQVTPPQPQGTSESESKADSLEARLMTFDTKLSTLVELLLEREANMPHPAHAQAQHPSFDKTSSTSPAHTQGHAQPPEPVPAPIQAPEMTKGTLADSELALLKDMIERMSTILEQQSGSSPGLTSPQAPAERTEHKVTGKASRPSIEHLRTELEKIAHEVNNELRRKQSS